MAASTIFVLLAIGFAVTDGQRRINFYAEKPGSCPPPLTVDICTRACYVDAHCQNIGKCCPTSCGGTVCSRPVTMRSQERFEKPGSCPAIPTGRWVCSSTCSSDSDCRETAKCCKNRCGAFACQRPDIEVIESVAIPYAAPPEVTYNDIPAAGNPFALNNN